jgi:hypothetical protein
LRRKEGKDVKKAYVSTFFVLGLLLIGLLSVSRAQETFGLAEVATGAGTLRLPNHQTVGINAVAVFLRENGQAEIWLMTPKQNLYAGGRWSRGSPTSGVVNVELTDDTEGGCISGCGTILLQDECVPISRLTLSVSRMDGSWFEAQFVTINARPCPTP